VPQKEPYQEYGRHSSFRSQRNPTPPGPPVAKWLFVVFVLLFTVVVGYDRWRGRGGAQVSPSVQANQEDAPDLPPLAESAPPQDTAGPVPIEAAETMPVASLPPAPAEESPPPQSLAEAEKPETTVTYVMEMPPGSSSFVGKGAVNGKDVMLLADTGASMVVVPEPLARQLGLKKGTEMPFKTGGGVVPHYATTIDRITLGRIELRDVEAAINPAMRDDFILLGMSALKLMEMEVGKGNKLVLKYKQANDFGGGLRTVEEEAFIRSTKDCAGNRGNKFDRQTLDCLRGK